MSRPVIPPLPHPSPHAPSQQTEVLRRRLASAEDDARQILDQIGKRTPPRQTPLGGGSQGSPRQTQITSLPTNFAFTQSNRDRHGDTERETQKKGQRSDLFDRHLPPPPSLPSEEQMVEPAPSSFSQDVLISRVCKLESMLQTLKVGVAGATSGVGSSSSSVDKKRLRAEFEEKLGQVQQELGAEVVRLKRQMGTLQEELSMESEARQRLKEESDKLKEALEEATQARAEASVAVEELSTTKQKLVSRINDLKEEVTREASLRASLEASHSTLMSRVHETEVIVEKERKEVHSASVNTGSMRQELARLKDELSSELSRRHMAEEACQRLIAEKEKAQSTYQTAQTDCQMASTELSRLQNQYADLIRQFEDTQKALDQQRTQMQELEGDRDRLRQIADKASIDQNRAQALQRQLNEADESHRLVKRELEEEASGLRATVAELMAHNSALQKKAKILQEELDSTKGTLSNREQDFSCAASGLETELNNVRRQLHSLEAEKQSVLKGKENLLEEVNQTVDSLMAERSRLHSELEKTRAEVEELRNKCRQTDTENIQLLERVGSFEHQQRTQRKVETTLQEMVDQKTKLAYENGKLQSQVAQLSQDLASAQVQCSDLANTRKASEMAQNRLIQLQKEASDYKVSAQKLEGQLQHVSDLLEQKQHELQLTQARREELERDMGKLLGRVEVLESREKNRSQQHQKSMEDAKSVNREIASTLEAVMHSHSQLQELVENLQGELGRRDTEIARLKNLRIKDQDGSKLDLRRMEEMVEALRTELKREQDKTGRKNNRDIAELKKQNSNMSTRNGELVATNTELRQRVGEMERTIGELQQKISAQKHKVDHMHKAKKHVEENLQRMKQMREDIDELEKIRDEYTQKNKEQAETISLFMQQMSSLQEEVQQLAEAQINTGLLLQKKEEALEKERRIREEFKKRYSETKKREDNLSKQKTVADDRLKEAHNESVEISRNLMEAHEWFKGKFEKLQDELEHSRSTQKKLEQTNQAQRRQFHTQKTRAQEAAERAKEMIKASRNTISQLADYTEQADLSTKQQLAELRAQMEMEREHALDVEDKYNHLKDAVVKVSTTNVRRSSQR